MIRIGDASEKCQKNPRDFRETANKIGKNQKDPEKKIRDFPSPTTPRECAIRSLFAYANFRSQMPQILKDNNLPLDTFTKDDWNRMERIVRVCTTLGELLMTRPKETMPVNYNKLDKMIGI